MTKRCFFEVGLKLLGVYLILYALTYGSPSVISYLVYQDTVVDDSWMKATFLNGIAQFFLPMFVGILFLLFGTKIGKLVIGNSSESLIQGNEINRWKLFDVLLKILALYFLLSSSGALVATCYEIFAVSLGSETWEKEQLNSDFIYNIVTVIFAVLLLKNSKCLFRFSEVDMPDIKIS